MSAFPDRSPARGSVFIATSLDGFIARPDGSIDWLLEANRAVPPGEDCGYAEFTAGIDGLVMGRASFEKALGFDPWPYGELPVIVLSRSGTVVPPALAPTVRVSALDPPSLMAELAAAGHRHLYIDGGRVVQSFLRACLIDSLTITTIPVLLGRGLPLFGPLEADVALRLVASRRWDFGFVQNRYEVLRAAPVRPA